MPGRTNEDSTNKKSNNWLGFAVVDVETTGLKPGYDRVIEVAIVLADGLGAIQSEYVTLLDPSRDVGPTHIHGIADNDVKGAPRFADVAGDIAFKLRNRVVVGHNLRFDLGMLAAEFQLLGHEMPLPANICTMKMAKVYGPELRNLANCCKHAGIVLDNHHSALFDARATLKLFNRYKHAASQQGKHDVTELPGFHRGGDELWPAISPSGKFLVRSSMSSYLTPQAI